MIVNLNCLCKVYVNDLGKKIWLSQLEGIPEEFLTAMPDLPDTIRNTIKEDDSIELPLWQIMNVFGPYMSDTAMPFKTTTLQLDKNPEFFKKFEKNKVD